MGLNPKGGAGLASQTLPDPDCISLFPPQPAVCLHIPSRSLARWAPGPPTLLATLRSCTVLGAVGGRCPQKVDVFKNQERFLLARLGPPAAPAARVLCARIPEPAPSGKEGETLLRHPDTSGSNCPWRAIRRELNIRQDGTNGMTGIESLLAQNGQTVVQRAVVIKHLDRSPSWTPQVAREHEGTWGLRGCGDGETDAGAPRGPSGGRQHSQRLPSPSAAFLFLPGLATASVLPPPAI